eukprot:6224311-Pyramimonas_sp.AAC.1
MQGSQWLEQIDGALIKADTLATCDKGKGSLIDYGIVRGGLHRRLGLTVRLSAPWRTHCGLRLDLHGAGQSWYHRAAALPRPLPELKRPKKQPDPNSKRSLKRQQQQQKRLDRLDTEHQNALSEILEEDHEDTEEVPFFISLDLWQHAVKFTDAHFELTEEMKTFDDYR